MEQLLAQAKKTIFGMLANLYRYIFLALPLRHYFERYFPEKGVFLEAGCGSAEDTKFLIKRKRTLMGMDYSEEALKLAKKQKNIDSVILGDILNLRLKKSLLTGYGI